MSGSSSKMDRLQNQIKNETQEIQCQIGDQTAPDIKLINAMFRFEQGESVGVMILLAVVKKSEKCFGELVDLTWRNLRTSFGNTLVQETMTPWTIR